MLNLLIPTTKSRRHILERCLNAIRDTTTIPHQVTVYENNDGGHIKASLNMISSFKDDALVLVLNDDMVCHEGWDKMVDLWDDNLVYPNDLINDGSLATAWLCTAGFMREHYYSGYIHHYGDTELTERARILGKLVYAKDCIIEHMHWTVGKSQKDETYSIVQQKIDQDRELFEERKKHNFYL